MFMFTKLHDVLSQKPLILIDVSEKSVSRRIFGYSAEGK
jgi:hypothetical protein